MTVAASLAALTISALAVLRPSTGAFFAAALANAGAAYFWLG